MKNFEHSNAASFEQAAQDCRPPNTASPLPAAPTCWAP